MPFGNEKATLKLTGEHNRRMVFQLLRRHRHLSRQQIADTTRLHRSTLSKIMSEFLDRRLVREVGRVEPPVKRVGKRQILLEVRGDIGWTLGVGINLEWARMVAVDAAGKLVAESRLEIGDDITQVAPRLKAHADAWLTADRRPAGRFHGIGVAVPGIADAERGVLIYSEYFRVRNYSLAEAVAAAFGARASVDNDARLEATAHLNQPDGDSGDNFVFFYVNHRPAGDRFIFTDFGSAVVLGGRIYRGAHRGAGELWGRLRPPPPPALTAEDLALIEAPDGAMNGRLEAAVDAIAPYIATLSGYMDPECVVLGGALDWHNRALLQHLQARVNEQIQPWYAERQVRVEAARIPGAGAAYGAALMAFDQIRVSDLNNRPARGRTGREEHPGD